MARTESSLLERLQGIIERTYDLQTRVGEIGRFVIGDEGYRRLYARSRETGRIVQRVEAAGSASAGARTLVRQVGDHLALSVYYPDSLIACLERHDPTRGLGDENVDAFAVLVEELDHLLVLVDRFGSRAEVSLLDLELHANVTKYLVLSLFVGLLRGRSRLDRADTSWVRFHLFEKSDFAEPDPQVNDRYREARRLAARYVRSLDAIPVAGRLAELRRFHRTAPAAKIARINAMS